MRCYKLRFRHVIRSFEFEYAFPSKLVLHATLESINPMNIVATFRAMEDFKYDVKNSSDRIVFFLNIFKSTLRRIKSEH